MKKTKNSRFRAFLKYFGALVVLLVLVGGGLAALWVSTFKIPALETLEQRKISQSTKIFDRTGEVLLFDVHKDVKRDIVPYEDISRHIKNATVAIEDAEFYEHGGLKFDAILRAFFTNIRSGEIQQGGSTITQQVVKNSVLTSEKALERKLKEAVLSIKLEQRMSKKDILTLYLNEIPYGGTIYGIQEASKYYFNKDASDLTIAESAYLAAIPRAPTYYSPYGNNREALDSRKNHVLQRMLEEGFIDQTDYDKSLEEEVGFQTRGDSTIKAPHFVIYVRRYLEEKYGADVIERGGLRVKTTLDYELQSAAQEIVRRKALENTKNFNAENAALVAMDPRNGHILSMVGSRGYFDDDIDGNFNVAIAPRQPGSAFKPFVYAQALREGYTPETVLFDVFTEFSGSCNANGTPKAGVNQSACYSPSNYDDTFRGPITIKNALAQSVNIPAVKALYLVGINDSIELARKMGISGDLDPNRLGLTMVLGGGEVSLLDMVKGYSVFANEGMRNPEAFIISVENERGEVLEEFRPDPERVLERETALNITDILSDNEARTPLYGANSLLYFGGRDVAAKTGTTNEYRDAWTLGYTPNITVGVWAGNNDNTSMAKKISGLIVTPIWREFMDVALKKIPAEKFNNPPRDSEWDDLKPILRGKWQGGESFVIDTISGKLATEHTPEETRKEITTGGVHNILHWVNKDNPLGPMPQNPSNDPQYLRWEYGVSGWATANGFMSQDTDRIPEEEDDIHTPDDAPQITITEPEDEEYEPDERISIRIDYDGKRDLEKLTYYLNGEYLGSRSREPFVYTFIPSDQSNIKEHNTLRVVADDEVYNKGEDTIEFEINQ